MVILFLTGTMNWGLAERGSGKFGYDFGLLSGMSGWGMRETTAGEKDFEGSS